MLRAIDQKVFIQKITVFIFSEKNRTVGQNPSERNYHIFYQLLLGVQEPLRSKLGLDDPKNFRYVSEAGCIRDPNLEVSGEVRRSMTYLSCTVKSHQSFLQKHGFELTFELLSPI